jgi:hypothetical protein
MIDKSFVLDVRHDIVSIGHQMLTHVSHQHAQLGVVALSIDLQRHQRVVDTRRNAVHDASLPDHERSVNAVAGDAHDPVGGRTQAVQKLRLSIDRQSLERRLALAVGGPNRFARGRPGQQLLYRVRACGPHPCPVLVSHAATPT